MFLFERLETVMIELPGTSVPVLVFLGVHKNSVSANLEDDINACKCDKCFRE